MYVIVYSNLVRPMKLLKLYPFSLASVLVSLTYALSTYYLPHCFRT
jgi:hypothetical protein